MPLVMFSYGAVQRSLCTPSSYSGLWWLQYMKPRLPRLSGECLGLQSVAVMPESCHATLKCAERRAHAQPIESVCLVDLRAQIACAQTAIEDSPLELASFPDL